MLMIRLARIGKKNKPFYRVIVSPKQRDLYGRSVEILGSYNPHTKELKVNNEKTNYWIEHGAQMSPTVNNLLIEKKVITGKKVKASRPRKPKKGQSEAKPAETGSTSAPKAEAPKTTAPQAEKKA